MTSLWLRVLRVYYGNQKKKKERPLCLYQLKKKKKGKKMIQNHLAWKASGTNSDKGVARGVEFPDGAGEFRHKGHVALIWSH